MNLYVRSKRARFLMNWIPVMLGLVLLLLLLLWVWKGLDNLGQ
jgi:energy-coupling factor transporter transmembrane protein EcfT